MTTLAGQTAIVTGAGRGLGRIYAHHLADLGANVGVVDLDLHSHKSFPEEATLFTADTVVDELLAKGARAAGSEANASDPQAMVKAVANLAEELGSITILVTNAGSWASGKRATELDFEQYHKMMASNFFSTVCSVNAVVPYMKKRRYGKIVTVASEGALQTQALGAFADYAAAKAAVVMYTKYLAQDLGEYGITANCLSPGYVESVALLQAGLDKLPPRNALGRLGAPEECARVVEFLVSDLSSYVTGAVIDASGGWVRSPAA